MKALAIVAAVLAVGSWARAAETAPEGAAPAPGVESVEVKDAATPETQTAWVERRIKTLREDIDRCEKRLETSAGAERGREDHRGKMTALRDRVTKLEERFSAEKTDEAGAAVEEELYLIEDDLNHLRRDTKHGARDMKKERR